ncbi:hypothetical protein KAFR_0F03720 [Kazachstania africana CBS 2517]|uniref:Transcriptional regulatory protein n=1 Tax=Kazachstania africana (strain ATCC 22294 / BCRC 22015 / CBS 2517 / CECT 1963 / NBRC 1671 / NRRL Y-8276) TaxID=1071382 RepID=H2AX68_KAZAF|nr:hypothetical protein KAFR_0F03720 [Kazachstania africana CBS 2517]CCF58968.1 hypothetical protein KAFR_0F03720 [Kazachstania africana CBS 2517]
MQLIRTVASRRYFSIVSILSSGHNKWSTIKHDKFKNDAIRNKQINKYVNQINVALKLQEESKLQAIIESAIKENVPKKVIENALNKSKQTLSGNLNVYEGIGPGGVKLIIEAQTDNKNRTIGLVRNIFNKRGHNLGPCLFDFNRVGKIWFHCSEDENALLEKLIDIEGFQDIMKDEDDFVIYCEPSRTYKIAKTLRDKYGYELNNTNIEYVPKDEMKVTLKDEETQESLGKFIDELKQVEDVIKVYSNEA